MDFAHLHVHDEYSRLDGFGNAKLWATTAVELGFDYLASTNHGNIDGVIKFQKACVKNNIKPIVGCELYIVDDIFTKAKGDKRYHVTVLVKNEKGWKNLLKMLTVAHLDGFYYKPRIDKEILLKYSEGLVVMSACIGSFLNAKWGEELICALEPDDVYLELMPHDIPEQTDINKKCIELHKKHGFKLVATNDCHYPTKESSVSQEVLLAIQSRAKWNDKNRWRFDVSTMYLKTRKDMKQAFIKYHSYIEPYLREALSNTIDAAKKCCDFRIEKVEVKLPQVPGYEDRDETELMDELIQKGFEERLSNQGFEKSKINEYKARIKEEMGLICGLDFQRYFLIVWELMDWCAKSDIMKGPGRGSVGGSLVAYLLYITDVDPLKYGLLFSRFINPARIDLPDIDMDFEDIKRDRIRKHLQDNYGKNCVAGISTFLKMGGRAALRDVGRVFDVPNKDVDPAAKSIVVKSSGEHRSNFCIEDSFSTFEDGIKFKKKYPEVVQHAISLEGQVKGLGQHAAGICISDKSLKRGDRAYLCKRSNNLVTNWDKEDGEYMGLMKLDVLGLSALTILNETRQMVKRNHNVDIDYDSLPLDDNKIYEEISQGHTIGAFQIGSPGLSRFCKELGVETFENIAQVSALWRPSTLRSGMTNEFSLRKRGEKEWDYAHPALKSITEDTYGIILYQEQVMKFIHEFGGLPWKIVDTIRKVIAKSQGDELFMKFKEQFVEGCIKKGILSKEVAEKLWGELASFGSYGFNKSHAIEYSLITYWDMWCKVNYPAEFMACTLTYGSADYKQDYINEARRLKLKIALPKIGISDPAKWTASGNTIFTPFSEIKGIGAKVSESIRSANKGGFFNKVGNDTKIVGVNKTILDNLRKIRAFEPDVIIPEEEIDDVKHLFNFDISSDPMRNIRGIYELIKKQINIKRLKNINFKKPTKNKNWYLGLMTAIKQSNNNDKENSKKSAYGFIKDDDDIVMITFGGKIYENKKYSIEHCEGQYIIVKANHPRQKTIIQCSDVVLENELLNCNIGELNLDLKIKPSNIRVERLKGCKLCELYNECREPVMPSEGYYNVMVIAETPGRDGDKQGKGLVGAAGNVLWDTLAKHDIRRNEVLVNSIVKCYPKKSKTPGKKHIAACGDQWLRKELAKSKPILILALGNAPVKYFTGEDGGITKLNGTTTWSREHNAWIAWCTNPASVLYDRENMAEFSKGIKNFARCFNNL